MNQADKKAQQRILEKIKLIRSSGGSININETKTEQAARIAKAKKDVKFCVEYYFPHYATSECADFHVKWANRVKRDKKFIGFAKWGRGQAKSVWNNIIIPFWIWLNEGDNYFVLIGQNERRAQQLIEDIRLEFEANPRIINDFGEQKKHGSWEDGFFITQGGFIGQALGLGQSCRGLRVGNKRPKQINGDDLETRKSINNERIQDEHVEWVEQELLPTMDGEHERLMFSNNWFAPVMFLRKLAARHKDWFVHEVIAYNPVTKLPTWKTKYDDTYFLEKEKKMGTLAAQAEYCHITHPKGKIFTPEQIQYTKLPRLDHMEALAGHWDVAYAGTATGDFNAIPVWGLKHKEFYKVTTFLKQCKMRTAVSWMCDFQKNLPAGAIVHWQFEAQFWNDEVERTIREVEDEYGITLNIVKIQVAKVKKYDRMLTMQPYYQNNRIWYGNKLKDHSDTQVGLAQLFGLEPNYKTKDDSPDADQQAIEKLSTFIYSNRTGDISTGKIKRKHVY